MANYKDLSGSVFGQLTVVEKTDPYITPSGNKSVQWLCRCSCGNETKATTSALNSGSKKMCKNCSGYGQDLTGKRFGKLVVIDKTKEAKFRWICSCDCGNEVVASVTELTRQGRSACPTCNGRKAELEGKVFGKLTVVSKAEPFVTSTGLECTQWLCRCECGTELKVLTGGLNDGSRRACRSCSGFDVDLTGQRFGHLTVLREADEHRVFSGGTAARQWVCECDCGREHTVITAKLNNGYTQSCGKCDLKSLFKDLTGQTFGNITVVSQNGWYVYPNGERDARWWCQCECGEEYSIRGTAIRKDGDHSCGCWRKKDRVLDEDMIGRVFGLLTVVERAASRLSSTGSTVNRWACQCECGRTAIIDGARLRNGLASNCGWHGGVSSNEAQVISVLDKMDALYSTEVTFDDLIGEGGRRLRYDFVVDVAGEKRIIECHGAQHYRSVPYFGGEETFTRTLRHDALKVEYAQVNQMPMLTIDCSKAGFIDFEGVVEKFITV